MFVVQFRFVVFRPFVDEIIVGKIRSCVSEGVKGKFKFPLFPVTIFTDFFKRN